MKHALSHISENGEVLGKLFLKDILMRQADKLLIERRISKRHRVVNNSRDQMKIKQTIEDKEMMVDRQIEKDLKWFLTTRQLQSQNQFYLMVKNSLLQKVNKTNKKSKQDSKRKGTGFGVSNILANNLSLKSKEKINKELKDQDEKQNKMDKIDKKEHSVEESHGH